MTHNSPYITYQKLLFILFFFTWIKESINVFLIPGFFDDNNKVDQKIL